MIVQLTGVDELPGAGYGYELKMKNKSHSMFCSHRLPDWTRGCDDDPFEFCYAQPVIEWWAEANPAYLPCFFANEKSSLPNQLQK